MILGKLTVGSVTVTDLQMLSHEGHHATVWKGWVNNQKVIVKRHSVDPSNADNLINDWQSYRASINELTNATNIFAIPNLAYAVDQKASSITFIDKLAEQLDISQMLRSDVLTSDEKIGLLSRLLKALGSIPYDNLYRTAFMVDGEFSNFCAHDEKGVDYIDLFPAHIRDEKTGLLKPNTEHLEGSRSLALETFLTGDIYGIIGRFWGMLRRDQPDLWRIAHKNTMVEEALDYVPPELKRYSKYLFETDTAFVQSVYLQGLADPSSMDLHVALEGWAQRDATPPPYTL